MKKEFCTYEQSLTLKELGYPQDEYFKCYTVHQNGYMSLCSQKLYLDEVSAPLIQQAFRFFREKYGLICQVTYDNFKGTFGYQIDGNSKHYFDDGFITYEEAEQACLDKLIELAKESKQ